MEYNRVIFITEAKKKLQKRRIHMSVLKITKDNFEQEVLQSGQPVLLDFWAEWCVPCKMAAPTLEQIAAEMDGTVKVGKVNVDEETELMQKFHVMSIPAFFVMKNGKVTANAVGVQDKDTLLNMLR